MRAMFDCLLKVGQRVNKSDSIKKDCTISQLFGTVW